MVGFDKSTKQERHIKGLSKMKCRTMKDVTDIYVTKYFQLESSDKRSINGFVLSAHKLLSSFVLGRDGTS